jgi:hypothetical protein
MAVVKFFRGLMIAMPISLALWALIALALYLTFHSSPSGGNELAAM